MTFEVRRGGEGKMRTEDPRCIYDETTLREMFRAGFEFYVDGMRATLSKLRELRDLKEER